MNENITGLVNFNYPNSTGTQFEWFCTSGFNFIIHYCKLPTAKACGL